MPSKWLIIVLTRPLRSALHLLLLLLGESVVADVAVAAVGTGVAQLATALLCHLQSYVRVGPDEVDLLDHQLAKTPLLHLGGLLAQARHHHLEKSFQS